ncbi:hypothetical protein EZV62_026632 [Acer yangbiense]|uniref:(+)-delta-cadinene synthase n=1 Tax=Acer yangbiense TaxID=1000413 RepID=A0A5C7GRJ8_9ROSI|nr:hypothetical protein EZV62_026632 [Acer yangbiense]
MQVSDSNSLLATLVEEIKKEMFIDINNIDPYSFVSPSAYDTAWLAMVPDSHQPFEPMFKDCLNWVLNNQTEQGFWGDHRDGHGRPTIESLPETLACLIALKRWNSGKPQVEKGLAFLHANVEKLLEENYDSYPRWFAIVFPAMVELSRIVGLEILFPDTSRGAMNEIFFQRQQIIETFVNLYTSFNLSVSHPVSHIANKMYSFIQFFLFFIYSEELVDDKHYYPPLLLYLEALPSYDINREDIIRNLSDDGSLFQSPSATARAFMATGNEKCLANLQSLVQRCANGVPPRYPMDEDLIKLCIVNQLQRLGLAEHFIKEIEEVLAQVYGNYKNEENASTKPINSVATKLYKDSLAFQLLRMHGYSVSPWTFCWFLNNQEIQKQIENDPEYFSTVMLNVYRATDVMFPDECEVQEARSLARNSLEKIISLGKIRGQDNSSFPSFHRVIEHELTFPWLTRLEHLEHRMWIEDNNLNALIWMGKTSFHRLSNFYNNKLLQLASQNYEFRQSIYQYELEELKRWSKDWGLSDMGFGREKTTYCYFATAASATLPPNSDVRLIIAKGATLITVADDFYDEKGSLIELKNLTNAVKRWDDKGLEGHSKTIFDALGNLVKEVAVKHIQLQGGSDITSDLKDIWYETFASWLIEAKRCKSGSIPSMDEYLETGMTSVATHTLVLMSSYLLNPSLPIHKLRPPQYETITKLLMLLTRLLNDTQSYQREQLVDGKTNFVLLYKRENPGVDIEDSIGYVREILGRKEKELLEHALMDGSGSDLPRACKNLHLACLKTFQMFFNSSNRYDSNSDHEILQDIKKAIYLPLGVDQPTKPKSNNNPIVVSYDHDHLQHSRSSKKKNHQTRRVSAYCLLNWSSSFKFHHSMKISFVAQRPPLSISSNNGYKNMVVPTKFRLSFV